MGNKKFLKAEQKYTEKQLAVLAKFGMGPALDVSGRDADLLDAVAEQDTAALLTLCERFDGKPSRLYKRVECLCDKGLLRYNDTERTVSLTPLAEQFLGCRLKDGKPEKKFRRFIESLTDEEIDRFAELVGRFTVDGSPDGPDTDDAE